MSTFRGHIIFFLLPFISALLLSCGGNELEQKMYELHQTVNLSETYIDAFHSRVSLLRQRLNDSQSDSVRADILYRLFVEYYPFNTDTAKVCVARLSDYGDIAFPTNVLKAWQSAIDGDRVHFNHFFDSFVPSSVPIGYRSDCYSLLAYSYLLVHQKADSKLCLFMARATLDPAISEDVKEMFLGTMYRFEEEYKYALEHFMNAYRVSSSTHMKSKTAYLVAHTYRVTGHFDKYEYWLAQAAIHDLIVPVKNYSSIQDLAMAELSRKHYKEASDMVDLFVKDALESKYWIRMRSAIEYEKTIISEVDKSKHRTMIGLTVSTALLLVLLIVLLLLLMRNARLNKVLSQTDKDKVEYIHKYIKMSLNYLGSVEQYRHRLRVLLKTEGKDALVAQLKSPSESEEQYASFYKEFDETFLKIYPNFISNVNSLLKPEARFPDEHSMNLPLRVLAAIKLDITESREIARFLNCAPASVYTYRSKMRANAIDGKDEFESKIRLIS